MVPAELCAPPGSVRSPVPPPIFASRTTGPFPVSPDLGGWSFSLPNPGPSPLSASSSPYSPPVGQDLSPILFILPYSHCWPCSERPHFTPVEGPLPALHCCVTSVHQTIPLLMEPEISVLATRPFLCILQTSKVPTINLVLEASLLALLWPLQLGRNPPPESVHSWVLRPWSYFRENR